MTVNAKPMNARILVADDEAGMRNALSDVLGRAGCQVEAVGSAETALIRLQSPENYDLLITDCRMEEMTGLELTRRARRMRPNLPIVMMTAYGTVEDAVNAMKEGADDYLLKPFTFETVIQVAREVMQRGAGIPRPVEAAKAASSPRTPAMIGKDRAWTRVVEIASDVADSSATVLLTGESGTGKEVLARYIHAASRREGPLVAINCAALPEGVLESELFGHEKGAFTGAVLSRKGRFELAQGGTILLDEVSEIPLSVQAKLLRVLQEREVSPIGGDSTISLDVRVIATTNRDLEKYVEDGHFRRDLFYRLHVIAIPLPPLRQRPGDIALLANHFLQKFARSGRPARRIGEAAIEALQRMAWSGNVRELENVIERACLLARSEEIVPEDLHLTGTGSSGATLGDRLGVRAGGGFDLAGELPTLDAMERQLILETLERTGGNRTRTATMLGVSVRTIRNKLHQYGIAENLAEIGE